MLFLLWFALRLRDEFNCGEELEKDEIDGEDIENLLIQQIEFCNTLIFKQSWWTF